MANQGWQKIPELLRRDGNLVMIRTKSLRSQSSVDPLVFKLSIIKPNGECADLFVRLGCGATKHACQITPATQKKTHRHITDHVLADRSLGQLIKSFRRFVNVSPILARPIAQIPVLLDLV